MQKKSSRVTSYEVRLANHIVKITLKILRKGQRNTITSLLSPSQPAFPPALEQTFNIFLL